jgi:hypothetical protein
MVPSRCQPRLMPQVNRQAYAVKSMSYSIYFLKGPMCLPQAAPEPELNFGVFDVSTP